jgi:hypothetical protein
MHLIHPFRADGVSADSLYRSLAPPDDAPSQKGPEGLNVKLMGFQVGSAFVVKFVWFDLPPSRWGKLVIGSWP